MRRGIVASVLMVGVTVLSAACNDSSPSKVRASAVYEAAIRWFTTNVDSESEPLPIFAEGRGEGATIDLGVQAEVVAATEDVAAVTFIDNRDEALEETDEGVTVVRQDGILLRLGPVLEDGSKVTLDVDQWLDAETSLTYRFTLVSDDDVWILDGEPLRI